MWAFLSSRLRMWLVLAVGAPLLSWLLGKVGDTIEARRGPNGLSHALQTGRDFLAGHAKGPLARRSRPGAGPNLPAR